MAFINKINNLNNIEPLNNKKTNDNEKTSNFGDILKKEIDETNKALNNAEKVEADIASGKVEDISTATITVQKAEMQMKMMLEVRNKAINAYKELLKTQI